MKTLILFSTLFAIVVSGHTQVIKAKVNQWQFFECDYTEDYFKVVSDTGKVFTRLSWGENEITFDLSSKTYRFFAQGNEFAQGNMEYKFEKGVYIFTCKTIDLNTNEPMDLFVTVNTLARDPSDVYVTQFYSHEETSKSYGMISYFEE